LIQDGEQRRFAMPVLLRCDFDARGVRTAARRSKDGRRARRLRIVRDWVVKFNAHGPEGLADRKAPGQAARLNGTHRAALAEIIDSEPMPALHGVVRW
jgi:transposase